MQERSSGAWIAAALAAALACGPGKPAETSGTDTDEATTSPGAGTSGPGTTGVATTATTGTTSPGTTGAEATTGGPASTGPGGEPATGSSGEGSSSGVGECVIDPALGICSAACDYWNDCCQCEGKILTSNGGATECVVPMGIVTAWCPWAVWGVRWDNEDLPSAGGTCGAEAGWVQRQEGGDMVVEFCGAACGAFLAGAFNEIELEMFCEVA